MRNDLLYLTAFCGAVASLVVLLTAPAASFALLARAGSSSGSASIFFVPSVTTDALVANYYGGHTDPLTGVTTPTSRAKVRVFIVPGHQPTVGGTEFKGVTERDTVVAIAQELATLLRANGHYEVVVARDTEKWDPVIQTYFDTHQEDVAAFEKSQKAQTRSYIEAGALLEEAPQVYHVKASPLGAYQLYALNKWANDTKQDMVLHLHLNDDAERTWYAAGKYDGFAVYVPDRQFSNAAASKAIGTAIAYQLAASHATSSLPKESGGVIEDRLLIATGANNTVDGASVLIEYGYIYEPQFLHTAIRRAAVRDYARATYAGLQAFFGDAVVGTGVERDELSAVRGVVGEKGEDVYALQSALHSLGFYPPAGKSLRDCPLTGTYRSCTATALRAYQAARGVKEGGVGKATLAAFETDGVY